MPKDESLSRVAYEMLSSILAFQAQDYGFKADNEATEALLKELEAKGYIEEQPDEERGYYMVTWAGAEAIGADTSGRPS